MTSAPFSILTAFSNHVEGGNPAIVVFLDLSLPTKTLATIARNFNQPIACFLSSSPLPSKCPKTVAFGIRWFMPAGVELDICGHGTLAAAKVVFERSDLVGKEVEVVEFHTSKCGVMVARKAEGGFITIQLPSASQVEVTGDERIKIARTVSQAFGKDDLAINYIGKGLGLFHRYMMVELDESENLKWAHIDANYLHERETGYFFTLLTTASSSGKEHFISRVFTPGAVPRDEDHVCGSAHCVMTPYWFKKQEVPRGQMINATQVSPREGSLRLIWESGRDVLTLMGEVVVMGTGGLQLP